MKPFVICGTILYMADTKLVTIGIMAHVDAGKTTLSEAMLYVAGELKQPGRVDHGSAFLDDDPIERERGITIFSRQARFSINEDFSRGKQGASDAKDSTKNSTEVTLIDTPGHVDFSAETERCLWVLDYALLVISGSEGVQAHTKTLVRMLKERGIPVFVFVNKMDIAIKKKEEIVDILKEELDIPAVDFSPTGGEKLTEEFIDEATLASPMLAEAVLEGMGESSEQSLTDGQIAVAIASGEIVPVMFGAALKNEGVAELLDVLGRFTKGFAQGQTGKESKAQAGKEPFAAKVYKTMTTKEGERLSFIKITGGSLTVRDSVTIREPGARDSNGANTREAKVNQIRLYQGGKFRAVDTAGPGTVCAVTGLGNILPGTALGEEEPAAAFQAEPFMAYSVEVPESKDPHAVMDDMQILSAEDPALAASWSEDGRDILIRIMGEVQLEVLRQIIKERFGYQVEFGQGRVLYQETITDTYEGVGHFEPLRHYAEVHLVISPGERGSGVTITSDVPEDELAMNWQRLIWTHLEEKAHTGVLTGSPITDIHISIAAGKAHLKHTMGGDFREATYRAVRNAFMQARRDGAVQLLEPWCEFEMELPAASLGRAVTDIKQMGASQESLEQREETAVIRGRAPSAKMVPYRQTLTGYTAGEGKLQITQCGYDEAVGAEDIIEEIGYDPERDAANPADSVFVNHSGSDIVKWDEVQEYMHIPSVLRVRGEGGAEYDSEYDARAFGAASEGGAARGASWKYSDVDAKEAARRRQAAEADLKRIFEMTYGPLKPKAYKESRVITAGGADANSKTKAVGNANSSDSLSQIDDNKAAESAARNEEIKAKHELKRGKHQSEATEQAPLLLIDGYNLIFADEELKELAGRDVGSARDSLIERLANYAGYTGMEVIIVFDAYKVVPGEGSAEKGSGVEIIYTAGNELADVRIGRLSKEAGSRRIYVVSSDRLVQQDVWTKGAMRISSQEFLAILTGTEEEIRARIS